MRSMSRRAAVCAKAAASATTTVAREQFFGFLRSLTTGAIRRQVLILSVAKGIEKRLHHAPAGLDAVGPRIQYRVADHAIIDERFIAGAWRGFEIIFVAERHAHAAERDRRSRNLGVKFEADAFVGLNPDHQEILGKPVD